MKYREEIQGIAEVTGKKPSAIHIVGGGVQNTILCQATADACGLPVIAGPVEATACGNILSQLLAQGEISGIAEAREVVKASLDPVMYTPGPMEEAYKAAAASFNHYVSC